MIGHLSVMWTTPQTVLLCRHRQGREQSAQDVGCIVVNSSSRMSYPSVCKLSVWNLGQVTTRQYIRPNTIQYNSYFVYDSYCPLIFASFFSRAHFMPPISSSSCSSLSFIPRSCPLFTFPFYLIFFLGKVGLVWHVADFATADRWLGVLIYSFKI